MTILVNINKGFQSKPTESKESYPSEDRLDSIGKI